MIFDLPKKIIETFEIRIAEGEFIIKKITLIRKLHHMGCTDNLPDDYQEERINYEITQKVHPEIEQN